MLGMLVMAMIREVIAIIIIAGQTDFNRHPERYGA